MKHDECQEHLLDHHYGELDDERNRQVAQHLAGCDVCALEFCRLRADLAGLAPVASATPHPEVHAALRNRVQREFGSSLWQQLSEAFSLRIPVYQPVLALALIAAVIVFVWPEDDTAPLVHPNPVVEQFDASELELLDGRIL